jgi:hypothetical protein
MDKRIGKRDEMDENWNVYCDALNPIKEGVRFKKTSSVSNNVKSQNKENREVNSLLKIKNQANKIENKINLQELGRQELGRKVLGRKVLGRSDLQRAFSRRNIFVSTNGSSTFKNKRKVENITDSSKTSKILKKKKID